MSYGSQTIQQQRRLIEVGSQEGSVTGEHGQGQIGKVGKNRSRKLPSICKHCGVEFYGFYREKNEYCSQSCHNEFRMMKWLPCSACMAKVGIGSNMAGKLLFMNGANIRRHWKRRGIKRDERAGIQAGRLRAQIKKAATNKEITNLQAQKAYESACMNEIKQAAKDFDWGSIASYEIAKKRAREYQSRTYHSSPKNSNFRLKKIARSRIYNAIKRLGNVEKPRIRYRTEKMIGCTIEKFKAHLEARFKRGMAWDNHGLRWHIDHIIPMSHFDLTDDEQLLAASHYTNMQPMWADENLAKSDKLQRDTQMELRICATH
jgi:hypothetical protein